jgi:hypothetical protein
MTIPTLRVTFLKQAQALRVNYSVINEQPGPIYLLNVLWCFAPDGSMMVDPHHAYRSLEAGGSLRVGKILPPLPRETFVEFTVVPFARRLQAKGMYEETFEMSLPVCEYNPYYPEDENTTTQDVFIREAEFWLSWVAEEPGLRAFDSPLGVGMRLEHHSLLQLIRTLKSPRTALSVNGRRWLGPFERF